jgi:hypothetical protein
LLTLFLLLLFPCSHFATVRGRARELVEYVRWKKAKNSSAPLPLLLSYTNPNRTREEIHFDESRHRVLHSLTSPEWDKTSTGRERDAVNCYVRRQYALRMQLRTVIGSVIQQWPTKRAPLLASATKRDAASSSAANGDDDGEGLMSSLSELAAEDREADQLDDPPAIVGAPSNPAPLRLHSMEKTPGYSVWSHVPDTIYQVCQPWWDETHVLFMVRNPVARLYSQYRMVYLRSNGEAGTLESILANEIEILQDLNVTSMSTPPPPPALEYDKFGNVLPSTHNMTYNFSDFEIDLFSAQSLSRGRALDRYSSHNKDYVRFLERGMYAVHLSRFYRHPSYAPDYFESKQSIPTLRQKQAHLLRDKVKVIRFEDFTANPTSVVEELWAWMGVDRPAIVPIPTEAKGHSSYKYMGNIGNKGKPTSGTNTELPSPIPRPPILNRDLKVAVNEILKMQPRPLDHFAKPDDPWYKLQQEKKSNNSEAKDLSSLAQFNSDGAQVVFNSEGEQVALSAPPLSPALKAYLEAFYRPYNKALETLLQRHMRWN